MRNGMETEDGNERVQMGTHQGPFSWVEMLIMTVLLTVSFLMS